MAKTSTPPHVERVLGKPGSVGEFRVLSQTPGRPKHFVEVDWRRRDGEPKLEAISCRSGHAKGEPCDGFFYRMTCSHTTAALDLIREERRNFRTTRDIVGGVMKKMPKAQEDRLVAEIADDPELLAALETAVATSRAKAASLG